MQTKPIFLTPGPAQLYPGVQDFIKQALEENIASISHRSPKYVEIHKGVLDKLKKIFKIPEDYIMFVGGSATYFMEKLVQNTVKENSFHFVNGSFSRRFFEVSRDLGKNAKQIKVGLGEGFENQEIQIPKNSELITFTATETSTGVETPQELIYKTAKENPNSIIAVDVVSAFPYYQLDFEYVDSIIFSVQKGFGLPAGLGIMFCSPRCIQKSQQILDSGMSVGSYHAFPLVVKKAKIYQTLETPNVLGMFLLNKVLKDMDKKGIKNVIQETEQKAQKIYSFFEKLDGFKPYVKNPQNRSKTVAVIEYNEPKKLIEEVKKHNLILGGGYGEHKDKQFRIANFPAISEKIIDKLLKIINSEIVET